MQLKNVHNLFLIKWSPTSENIHMKEAQPWMQQKENIAERRDFYSQTNIF
jgi:hypothetical protein